MEFCVLASGSKGNAIYVAAGNTRVLIDCGVSLKEARLRLACIGVTIEQIDALCVTHEHSDHCAGLPVLARRTEVALYANEPTASAVEYATRRQTAAEWHWNVFATGSAFTIGELTFEPFSVPHDAADPVAYVVSDGTHRVGIATDMGMPTTLVRKRLAGCHALILESNHDTDLLRNSQRSWALKQRIAGRRGHLSNDQSAELLVDLLHDGLQSIFLAHLSDECNRPELARYMAERTLKKAGYAHIPVKLASQSAVAEHYTLT